MIYTLTEINHAELLLDGIPLTTNQTWTQDDIDQGLVQLSTLGQTAPNFKFTYNNSDPVEANIFYFPKFLMEAQEDDLSATTEVFSNTDFNYRIIDYYIDNGDGARTEVSDNVILTESLDESGVSFNPNQSFEYLLEGETEVMTFTYEAVHKTEFFAIRGSGEVIVNGQNDTLNLDNNKIVENNLVGDVVGTFVISTIEDRYTFEALKLEPLDPKAPPDHNEPDDFFFVNNDNELITKVSFDHEEKSSYELIIKITDNLDPNNPTITREVVTIEILDSDEPVVAQDFTESVNSDETISLISVFENQYNELKFDPDDEDSGFKTPFSELKSIQITELSTLKGSLLLNGQEITEQEAAAITELAPLIIDLTEPTTSFSYQAPQELQHYTDSPELEFEYQLIDSQDNPTNTATAAVEGNFIPTHIELDQFQRSILDAVMFSSDNSDPTIYTLYLKEFTEATHPQLSVASLIIDGVQIPSLIKYTLLDGAVTYKVLGLAANRDPQLVDIDPIPEFPTAFQNSTYNQIGVSPNHNVEIYNAINDLSAHIHAEVFPSGYYGNNKGDGFLFLEESFYSRLPSNIYFTQNHLATGDINGDGTIDIFISESDVPEGFFGFLNSVNDYTDEVRFIETGTIAPFSQSFLADRSNTELVDIDLDGDLDAMISKSVDFNAEPLSILLNDGQGNFQAQAIANFFTSFDASSFPDSIDDFVVADMNADGYPDLVVTRRDEDIKTFDNFFGQSLWGEEPELEGITIFYNNATQDDPTTSFTATHLPLTTGELTIPDHLGFFQIDIADMNGDERLDIIGTSNTKTVIWFQSESGSFPALDGENIVKQNIYPEFGGTDPTSSFNDFGPGSEFGFGASSLILKQDPLAQNHDELIAVVLRGPGTFEDIDYSARRSDLISYKDPDDPPARYQALGDIDNDGDLDLMLSSAGGSPNTLILYKNNFANYFPDSNDQYGPLETIPLNNIATVAETGGGSSRKSIQLADLNRDGLLDLVYNNLLLFLNTGDGTEFTINYQDQTTVLESNPDDSDHPFYQFGPFDSSFNDFLALRDTSLLSHLDPELFLQFYPQALLIDGFRAPEFYLYASDKGGLVAEVLIDDDNPDNLNYTVLASYSINGVEFTDDESLFEIIKPGTEEYTNMLTNDLFDLVAAPSQAVLKLKEGQEILTGQMDNDTLSIDIVLDDSGSELIQSFNVYIIDVNLAPYSSDMEFTRTEQVSSPITPVIELFAAGDPDIDDTVQTLQYTLSANPQDGPIIIDAENGAGSSNQAAKFNGTLTYQDGAFSFESGPYDFADLWEGQSRDVTFDYFVTDRYGRTSIDDEEGNPTLPAITITVNGVGPLDEHVDIPILSAPTIVQSEENINEMFFYYDLSHDSQGREIDLDGSEITSLHFDGLPSGASLYHEGKAIGNTLDLGFKTTDSLEDIEIKVVLDKFMDHDFELKAQAKNYERAIYNEQEALSNEVSSAIAYEYNENYNPVTTAHPIPLQSIWNPDNVISSVLLGLDDVPIKLNLGIFYAGVDVTAGIELSLVNEGGGVSGSIVQESDIDVFHNKTTDVLEVETASTLDTAQTFFTSQTPVSIEVDFVVKVEGELGFNINIPLPWPFPDININESWDYTFIDERVNIIDLAPGTEILIPIPDPYVFKKLTDKDASKFEKLKTAAGAAVSEEKGPFLGWITTTAPIINSEDSLFSELPIGDFEMPFTTTGAGDLFSLELDVIKSIAALLGWGHIPSLVIPPFLRVKPIDFDVSGELNLLQNHLLDPSVATGELFFSDDTFKQPFTFGDSIRINVSDDFNSDDINYNVNYEDIMFHNLTSLEAELRYFLDLLNIKYDLGIPGVGSIVKGEESLFSSSGAITFNIEGTTFENDTNLFSTSDELEANSDTFDGILTSDEEKTYANEQIAQDLTLFSGTFELDAIENKVIQASPEAEVFVIEKGETSYTTIVNFEQTGADRDQLDVSSYGTLFNLLEPYIAYDDHGAVINILDENVFTLPNISELTTDDFIF